MTFTCKVRCCWPARARWAERSSQDCSPAASMPARSSCRIPIPRRPVADLLADNGIDVLPFIDELTQPPGRHPRRGEAAGDGRGAAAAGEARRAADAWWCRSPPAGRIASFEKHFPGGAIVRAMPNTPAAIGRGITVAVANARRDAGAARAGRRTAVGRRRSRCGSTTRRCSMRSPPCRARGRPTCFCWPNVSPRRDARPGSTPRSPSNWRARRSSDRRRCSKRPTLVGGRAARAT